MQTDPISTLNEIGAKLLEAMVELVRTDSAGGCSQVLAAQEADRKVLGDGTGLYANCEVLRESERFVLEK